MVFVGNVQKSPIAIHLKGLDSSFEVWCQIPGHRGVKEDWQNKCPHQRYLSSKRDVLVPPYNLQSRKSCCCLGNPKNIGLESFISDDWLQVLEVLHCFKLLTILSWSLFRSHLGCLSPHLFCLDQSPFCTVLWWLYQDGLPWRQPSSFSVFTDTCMLSAKRKLVISRPSLPKLPSWSSNASYWFSPGSC